MLKEISKHHFSTIIPSFHFKFGNKKLYKINNSLCNNFNNYKRDIVLIHKKDIIKTHASATILENQINDLEDNKFFEGKKALVIGAGPSGATTAAYLAKNGFNVRVYEKLDHPDNTKAQNIRPIPLVLFSNTVKVLKGIGIDLPNHNEGFKNGLHSFSGMYNVQANGDIIRNFVKGEKSILGERYDIAKLIISDITKKYKDKVEFNFNCICESVNFDEQIVRFKNEKNETIEETYDLLIGSDGIGSKVREALQKYDKDFTSEKRFTAQHYCPVKGIGPANKDDDILNIIKPGDMVTFSNKNDKFEGNKIKLLINMVQLENGMYNGIIFGRKIYFNMIRGKEHKWFDECVSEKFPIYWKDEFVKQLSQGQIYSTGCINKVSTFIGPKTILIGDAAHVVTPTLGVGCNIAIIDAQYINMALNGEKDLDKAIMKYNELRYDEIQNVQELHASMVGWITPNNLKDRIWSFYGLISTIYHAVGNSLLPNAIRKSHYIDFVNNEISATDAVKYIKTEANAILGIIGITLILIFSQFLNKMLF